MRGIAYIVDGTPRLTWAGGPPVLDDTGEPTGEVAQDIAGAVAALGLAEGAYTLVDETTADAWLQANTPAPTAEELTRRFTLLIQKRLDDFARTRNYDNIMSAATYATSTVEKFRVEGQYCVEARDATWATGYELLETATASGTIPTWPEVEAALPVLAWPASGPDGSAS